MSILTAAAAPVSLALAGASGLVLGAALSRGLGLLEELLTPATWKLASTLQRADCTCPALYAFARFGIADVLAAGPKLGMTAEQLAEEVGADASLLYRTLRFLSMLDRAVVALEPASGRFSLTGYGRLLKTEHPQSLKCIALYYCMRAFRHGRTALYDIIRTGKPGFKVAWGEQHASLWDVLAEHDRVNGATKTAVMEGPRIDVPCEVEAFDGYMTALWQPLVPLLAWRPLWSRFRSIVDVGGASGATLKAVLSGPFGGRIEQAVVMDLPQVIDSLKPDPNAPAALSFIQGDFFQPLPKELHGVDAVLMKFILHDWSDEQCVQILNNVRPCLEGNGGMLVLVEQVVPAWSWGPLARLLAAPVVFADMEMTVLGGRERTRAEWAQLLGSAGFKLKAALPVIGAFHILLAHVV